MHRPVLLLLIVISLCSCASRIAEPQRHPPIVGTTKIGGERYPSGESVGPHSPLIEHASSETYGLTPDDPIKVGTGDPSDGPDNEKRYLNALLGPNGQVTSYRRVGSCCPFATPNYELSGLLDVYEVSYEGLEEPIILYLNMYDPGPLLIPQGFTAR